MRTASARLLHASAASTRDVHLHGAGAERQLARDPLVGEAARDAAEHVELSRREHLRRRGRAHGAIFVEKRVQRGGKGLPRGLLTERHVVLALEWHEACARDERGELAPALQEDELIAATVERDGRARHARGELLHVEAEHRTQVLLRHVRRGGHALKLLERLALRLGRLAHEFRDEDLPQRRAAGPPAEALFEQHVGLRDYAGVGVRRAEVRPQSRREARGG